MIGADGVGDVGQITSVSGRGRVRGRGARGAVGNRQGELRRLIWSPLPASSLLSRWKSAVVPVVVEARGDGAVRPARHRGQPVADPMVADPLPAHLAQGVVGPMSHRYLLIATTSAMSNMLNFSSWEAAPYSGVIT